MRQKHGTFSPSAVQRKVKLLIKVVKHPGHGQAIKPIRTRRRYARPAAKEMRQNACELLIGQQAGQTFSSTNHGAKPNENPVKAKCLSQIERGTLVYMAYKLATL